MKHIESMINLLNDFQEVIKDYHVLRSFENEDRVIFYVKIDLIDTSKLFIKEILIFLESHAYKRKYSYQWMDTDNQLIIRWDNTPHHTDLSTFPHHKHVKEGSNVLPSPELSLKEIFTYIREQIQGS